MNTVIYARYSSDLQKAASIEDQLRICRERCTREGWTVVGEYHDRAISGASGIGDGQRPGLADLFDRIDRGGVDQLLTESTDRLARHQGDAFAIRERLDFAGVRLFTLIDGLVDDITGTIKGLLDSRMRKDLGARIRRGQQGAVAQGRAPAGIAYGYARVLKFDDAGNAVRGLRAIDPAQASIVQRIFADYAGGTSPQAIAEALNREHVPSPRGGGWLETTIRGDRKRQNGMLSNRLYIGELVVNRTRKITDPATRRALIRPNPESEWITHQVPELAIVDRALWLAVQDRLGEAVGRPVNTLRRPRKLLSGLVECGVCGGNAIIVDRGQWGCSRRKDGRRCTNGRTIQNDRLVASVLETLHAQLLDPDYVALYVRTYHAEYAARSNAARRDRESTARQLAEANRKIARFVAAIAAGGAFEEISAALAQARADRDRLQAIADLADGPDVIALHPRIADDYRQQVAALGQALQAHPDAQTEAVPRLRALIDRVILLPNPDGRSVLIETRPRITALLEMTTTPRHRTPIAHTG